jgi:ATP-dependent Clp protease, protease subunit
MAKVSVRGAIVSNDDKWIYDWFEMDATSPRDVSESIEKAANGSDLDVEINSGGGDVFAGSEIYTALKEYPGNVTIKVVGIAASAASIIAMAGNKILMSPTSQMMIHNASVIARGDYRDMDHTSNILKNVNSTIANAYKLKSGMSDEQLKSLMDAETWFTPQQALDHKLIDEIMFNNELKVAASFSNGLLPQEVIEKVRNQIFKEKNPVNSKQENEADFFNAKLNLLKMRREVE